MDTILLRFRNLTQGVDTIKEHNKIVEQKDAKEEERGRVLWGWWKKEKEPLPNPTLSDLQKEIDNGRSATIYIVNSDTGMFYKAPLYKIYYTGDKIFAPASEMCPEYYRETKQYAWFEIGHIDVVGLSNLSQFVLSNSNRVTKNSNSIPYSDIGRFLEDLCKENQLIRHPVSIWFLCHINELGNPTNNYPVSNVSHVAYPIRGRYILHLSDIHFGDEHAYKNPCSPALEIGKEYLVDELLEDLKCLNDEGGLSGKNENKDSSGKTDKSIFDEIGLVLITGDLSWQANPHEFANAEKFIEELKKSLGIENQQIVIVPGNHDIEWMTPNGKIDANAELNYRYFYRHIYNYEPNDTLTKISRYSYYIDNNEGDDRMDERHICVIALNSCRLESPESAGYGYVGSKQLKMVQQYMNQHRGEFDYTIAMLHHHVLPVNYVEEYDFSDKKVSMLLDAESVISTLLGCGVNVILHGHQHQPYFSSIERIIPGYIDGGRKVPLRKKLGVVGAGSIGVKSSHINAIGRNTYNIISIGNDNNLHILERIRGENGVGFFSYNEKEIVL